MHASLLQQQVTTPHKPCPLHQPLALSTSQQQLAHFSSSHNPMYAEQQLQAQEPVPNTLLAQAHEATSAVTHMSQPAPSALTSPSNSNYRQPMHNSDNSTAATAGEENTAAHDPTGLPSSGHTVQDTSTTGTDIQQDMQLEAQRQQQQEQGQTHGKQQKPRPTHFVSLRVSHSPQVVESIQHVQQQLVAAAPELQPCLLDPVTAHITVMVLHMPTAEQEAVAELVMQSLPDVLQQQGLGQLQVTLQGLSTFRNQVLYLDVLPGPAQQQLQRFGNVVIAHFRAQGSGTLIEEAGRGFTPHVTVAKTSRLIGHHQHRRNKGKGRTKIPAEAWDQLADVCAGEVLLAELQICSMQGRKAREFYRVTHSVPLPEAPTAAPLAAVIASTATEPEASIAGAATATPAPTAKAAGTATITEATPAALTAVAATAAATATPAGQPAGAAAAEPRKRAASPLESAKRRFRKLLDALVCRRRDKQQKVEHQQPD